MAKKTPPLDSEDAALWKEITKDVPRLRKRALNEVDIPAPPLKRRPTNQLPTAKPVSLASIPLKPLASGAFANVDKATAARLKKGIMQIDGTLDLHGRTREEAWISFRARVASAYAEGQRCLLVITGKGRLAPKEAGVLKASLPQWINEPDIRPHILGFAPAQSRHGGEGAWYVLIKRKRLQ